MVTKEVVVFSSSEESDDSLTTPTVTPGCVPDSEESLKTPIIPGSSSRITTVKTRYKTHSKTLD